MLNLENNACSSVMLLPRAVANHLKNASLSELKVIIYIFAHNGTIKSEKTMAKELGMTESDILGAIAFWRGAGVLEYKNPPDSGVTVVSETPHSQKTISYTQSELANGIEQNEDVRSLLNFASQRIGKILTPTEQACIFSLVDALGLGCDLVMAIIEYCVSNDKKTVKYIERTASRLFEENGIDTCAKFEEYIEQKNAIKPFEMAVRRIIGGQNRGLTQKESKIIEELAKNNVSEQLISAAYERTIRNISKPSLEYMSKIINTWLAEGITSPEQLNDRQRPLSSDSSMEIFNFEDFLEGPGVESEGDGKA